jgi:hypothetical protein
MIDLELDRMYAEGALNTYIDELSEWIRHKEAAIAKDKHKAFLAPVIKNLEEHIDFARSLLSKAENFRAHKEGIRY